MMHLLRLLRRNPPKIHLKPNLLPLKKLQMHLLLLPRCLWQAEPQLQHPSQAAAVLLLRQPFQKTLRHPLQEVVPLNNPSLEAVALNNPLLEPLLPQNPLHRMQKHQNLLQGTEVHQNPSQVEVLLQHPFLGVAQRPNLSQEKRALLLQLLPTVVLPHQLLAVKLLQIQQIQRCHQVLKDYIRLLG